MVRRRWRHGGKTTERQRIDCATNRRSTYNWLWLIEGFVLRRSFGQAKAETLHNPHSNFGRLVCWPLDWLAGWSVARAAGRRRRNDCETTGRRWRHGGETTERQRIDRGANRGFSRSAVFLDFALYSAMYGNRKKHTGHRL